MKEPYSVLIERIKTDDAFEYEVSAKSRDEAVNKGVKRCITDPSNDVEITDLIRYYADPVSELEKADNTGGPD